MIDQNRKASYEILLAVETKGAYTDSEIKEKEGQGNIDGSFVRRLVYGVMENKLLIDYILDGLIKRGVKSVNGRVIPILRMGVYQIRYMDSVPDYAAIDTSVELAKKYCKGQEGFVNGVLRNFARTSAEIYLPSEDDFSKYLSIKYSIDESIISNWISEFGKSDCEKIAKGMAHTDTLSIRVNISRATTDEVASELEGLGYEVVRSSLTDRGLLIKGLTDSRITETELFRSGKISIQSQESIYISDLVDGKPGENVIDVCAAPGGKTGAIAEKMNNSGSILAWDNHEHRVDLIKSQMKRLEIENVTSELSESTIPREDLKELFDKVLVDVPCSGYGVMGRKPEIRYRSIEEIKELPLLQSKILDSASTYTKQGGELIYSTCTINRDENQKIVEKFLANHNEYSLKLERQLTPLDGYRGFYVAVLTKVN